MHNLDEISNYSDKELTELYRKGENKVVIAQLYKRYTRFVFLVAMKYMQDEYSAQEIASKVFEKLIVKLKEKEINHFKSWLFKVTQNECMMMHRKSKSEKINEKKYGNEETNFVEFQQIEHLNDRTREEQKLQELKKAIQQLKEEQRKCIELFYLQEKSYAEISQITGFSIKKVKSYIQNGKRNLKNKLS